MTSDVAASEDETETERVLTGLSRGRFGKIDPLRLARHIMAVTPHSDWAIRRAALDALARRHGFAARDELHVSERPSDGIFGIYTTGAKGRRGADKSRPYATALLSVEPLRMSCSCTDFVRSSLGLCKHGLTVLDALEKAGRLTRASAESAPLLSNSKRPTLTWDAREPLRGDRSRLARLRYTHGGRAQPPAMFDREAPRTKLLENAKDRHDFIVDLERRLARGAIDAEPSIWTLLEEEKLRATRILQLGDASEPLKRLSGLTRKLYPYQREGVKRFFETGRLLLADDMGLGKTTQAIAACHGLFEAGRVRRGLLIVPAALKAQWKREWDATTKVPLTLVEGSPAERARLYRDTKSGFLVIGYEQLLRDLVLVQAYAAELVVLDEAQRIKNWATKSAAYVKALNPKYRLVLTGTPMENRFDELASIMDFVDDFALEPKWRLVPFHQVQAGDGGKGVGGAKNLDLLRARLSGVMMRRIRQDVIAQLPSRTDTRVPVEMTELQRQKHDELLQPIAELMSTAGRRPLRQQEFLKLMQLLTTQRILCNGVAQLSFEQHWPRCQEEGATPQILEGLFAPKLSVLRGLIEQVVIAQKRKVVVFSQWRKMLKLSEWAVRDLLAEAGMRAVFFTGAESSKQREQAIVDFHDEEAVTVMFLSDAGGVGLNLQRAASACINLELPWNPAVLEQRIGRIYRLGQKLPIDVYNLVSEDGIESRIARLIGQKKAIFSALFDGQSEEVLFDGDSSFLEGVKKLVEPVVLPEMTTSVLEEEEPTVAATELLDSAPTEIVEPHPLAALASLKVSTLADGGLRIDAPAALAEPLASLLEQLARSLRANVSAREAAE
jgi:superfamily II DNA or RNA helicase